MMKMLIFLFILASFVQGDDLWLRNYYMPMAAAAYSDDPKPCLSNIQKYWYNLDNQTVTPLIYGQYSIFCDSFNEVCGGFIAIDNATKYITIAFGGNPNYEQFYEHNFDFDEMVSFVAGGKVSKQMFERFNNIWTKNGMKDDVLTLKNKYPDYQFYIIGHSLGGASASLAAATILSTGILPSKNVFLYTFGQPRTGDLDYANAVNALITQSNGMRTFLMLFFLFEQKKATAGALCLHVIRVVHNHDIIPHYPILNTTVYYNHISELWYPNDMVKGDGFVDCSTSDGEDPKCSDSLSFGDLKGDEHKFYYGRQVYEYGIGGCADLASSIKKQ